MQYGLFLVRHLSKRWFLYIYDGWDEAWPRYIESGIFFIYLIWVVSYFDFEPVRMNPVRIFLLDCVT